MKTESIYPESNPNPSYFSLSVLTSGRLAGAACCACNVGRCRSPGLLLAGPMWGIRESSAECS